METQANYDTGDDAPPFSGFVPPTANYSKLPHALIDTLPLITSLAEMKVILYVLRHTWGYQDDEKRISLDEFRNGRKHSKRYLDRHPDASPRIDGGTGMSVNAIKDGIKRAVKHGFLSVDEDASDKARIERWYSLSESDYQELIPDRQKLIPGVSKVDSRTLKETLIETTEREEPPAADSPDPPFFLPDETPPPPTPPRNKEQCLAGIQRAIEHNAQNGNGRAGVADPTRAVDPWADNPVKAWCAFIRLPYSEQSPGRVRMLAADLRKIATSDGLDKTPDETVAAIRAMAESAGCQWMRTAGRPTHKEFTNVLTNVLCGQTLPEGGNGRHDKRAGGQVTEKQRRIYDDLMARRQAAL